MNTDDLGFIGRTLVRGEGAGLGEVDGGDALAAALLAGEEEGADDDEGGEELAGEGLDGGEDGEPEAHPIGEVGFEPGDGGGGDPMGELHLLDLLADHDEEDNAEEHAGGLKHFAIGEFLLEVESDDGDDADEDKADGRAAEGDRAAELEIVSLQEENDLEAFAVEGEEAEEGETAPEGGAGDAGVVAISLAQEMLLLAGVHHDPAAPIDLVKEPVHDDEQHENGQQAGGGLEIERGDAVAEAGEDADGDEPGDGGGDEAEAYARHDGAAVALVLADHTGHDGGEDEHTLEALAEDEDRDIEHGGVAAGALRGGVGRAASGHALPNEEGGDEKGTEYQERRQHAPGDEGEKSG